MASESEKQQIEQAKQKIRTVLGELHDMNALINQYNESITQLSSEGDPADLIPTMKGFLQKEVVARDGYVTHLNDALHDSQVLGDDELASQCIKVGAHNKDFLSQQISVATAGGKMQLTLLCLRAGKGDKEWLDDQLLRASRRDNGGLVRQCMNVGARVDRRCSEPACFGSDDSETKAFVAEQYKKIEKYEKATQKAIVKSNVNNFFKAQKGMGRNPLYEAMIWKSKYANDPAAKATCQSFMLKIFDKVDPNGIENAYDIAESNGDKKSMAVLKEMGKIKIADAVYTGVNDQGKEEEFSGVQDYIQAEKDGTLPSWIQTGSKSATTAKPAEPATSKPATTDPDANDRPAPRR